MLMRSFAPLFGLAMFAALSGGSALAGSQSSDTSSNCSNGRCTRVDTYSVEDRRGRRTWRRVEAWDERRGRSQRDGRYRRGER